MAATVDRIFEVDWVLEHQLITVIEKMDVGTIVDSWPDVRCGIEFLDDEGVVRHRIAAAPGSWLFGWGGYVDDQPVVMNHEFWMWFQSSYAYLVPKKAR